MLLPPGLLSDLIPADQLSVVNLVKSFLIRESVETQGSHHAASDHAREVIHRLDRDFAIVNFSIMNDPDLRAAADPASHDRYFGIVRVTGLVQPLVVRSILDAKRRFHDAMVSAYARCDQQFYSGIGVGLTAALAHLAGETPPRLTVLDRPPAGRSSEAPAGRWVLGHQIFAAITQCIIIIAMNSFEIAMNAQDRAAAGGALDLAATLLLASASAFRFTADFSAASYSQEIRPSMGPEHVGSGFSGLLSEDHRHLVDVMVRTRPLMGKAAAALPEQHRRVGAALSYVYDDHKLVCARFGGAEGSSLRSDACSEVPGVVLLDRFKRARTRLLTPMAEVR